MSYCVEKGISHDEWLSWSPESRAKHLAYMLEQADSCQLCGTSEWEWKEDRFAYEIQETFCRGCYLKEVASEEAGKLPGTTVNLVPATSRSRAQQIVIEQRRAAMMQEDEQEG